MISHTARVALKAVLVASPALAAGPDVIVGDLHQVEAINTTIASDRTAFAVGTTSCNVGTTRLNWLAEPSNQHPVIGQNLFRYSVVGGAGRFEQIGQSFVKHGFYALSESLCASCIDITDGSQLGVGCSDPYDTFYNRQQTRLGPRSQINPATGDFPIGWNSVANLPARYTLPPIGGGDPRTLARRGQVFKADINPTLNPAAVYFVEGQYIAKDDTAASNGHNNGSYRRVNIAFNSTNGTYLFTLSPANGTRRQAPAIEAWRVMEPGVTVVNSPFSTPAAPDRDQNLTNPYTNIAGDGRVAVAYKITDLGNSRWAYEYAVQNLTSDRAVNAVGVSAGSCVSIESSGFHQTFNHSGEEQLYDGQVWPGTKSEDSMGWAAPAPAGALLQNAIRWGTMYNFRFIANRPPAAGQMTLSLLKPGSPASIALSVQVPQACPPICVADFDNGSGTGVPDGGVGIEDLLYYLFLFENGVIGADIDDGSGSGTRDNGVGIEDLLFYLMRFEAGC